MSALSLLRRLESAVAGSLDLALRREGVLERLLGVDAESRPDGDAAPDDSPSDD